MGSGTRNKFSMLQFVQIMQSAKTIDRSVNKYANSTPKTVNFPIFLGKEIGSPKSNGHRSG